MAAKSALLRGAVRVVIIDTLQYGLDKATAASGCETILWEDGAKDVVAQVRSMTEGRAAGVCVDAVGFEIKGLL